ncbi:hypothetical protein, partial [Vibrio diabolicus]
TFVSHRIGYMPLHILAKTVNHKSLSSTVYYGVEDAQETKALFASNRKALRILDNRDGSSTRITSTTITSKIEEAYTQSPSEAINLYGMTSIPLVVIDDEGDEIHKKTGLDLISSTPKSMIAYTNTHICVHNLECPSEIVNENGGFQRCGVCRIK